MKLLKLVLVFLFVGCLAQGQAGRYDQPILTIQSSQPTPGNMYPVFALPGAAVQVCNYPANAVPCTNLAPTFTDITGTVLCPLSPVPAQMTRPGSNVCVPKADNQGSFGVWIGTGNYQYTVVTSYGSFGPYDFYIGAAPGSFASLTVLAPQQFTGPISASINGHVNVLVEGAKGDCSTDDQTAIQLAMAVAGTYNPPAVLDFPKTASGCYLTSTLTWNGASLKGEPSIGVFPSIHTAGVVIKGKPQQDILHIPDPGLVSTVAPANSWKIQDITFVVDDSVNATGSFPHRWPGRWFTDATISLSTPTILTTTDGLITCDDIGQNIQINGAGVAAGNLQTTIANVTPCGGKLPKTITLATSASVAVTNTSAYITPANIALGTTIGNCAIAADDRNGDPSTWTMTSPSGSGFILNLGDQLHGVSIMSTSGTNNGQNGSCGIFTQGVWGMYNLDARYTQIDRLVWGIAMVCSELNPRLQSCSNDFQKWDHQSWELDQYPWISYNGGQAHITDVEITSPNGMQILQSGNHFSDAPTAWYVDVPEFESQGGINSGFRVEGQSHTFINTALSSSGGGGTLGVLWGAHDSKCINCNAQGGSSTVTVNDFNNYIDLGGGFTDSTTVIDNAVGNTVLACYLANPFASVQMPRCRALNSPHDVGLQEAGVLNGDHIGGAFYYNNQDLFITPYQMAIGGCAVSGGAPCASHVDATSPTGAYFGLGNFNTISHWPPLENLVVGKNIPAGPVAVWSAVNCVSGTSVTTTVFAGATNVGSGSYTCAASGYLSGSVNADFTSQAGQNLGIQFNSGSDINIGWIGIAPLKQAGLSAITGSLGGGSLVAGACATTTVTIPGATAAANAVVVTPVADPGNAFYYKGFVSGANTVTVAVCTNLAAGATPTATTYKVRLLQ